MRLFERFCGTSAASKSATTVDITDFDSPPIFDVLGLLLGRLES